MTYQDTVQKCHLYDIDNINDLIVSCGICLSLLTVHEVIPKSFH